MAQQTAKININATADGDNTIIAAPAAGYRIRIFGYVVTVTAAASPLILKSGASGTEHARFTLPINGGVSYPGNPDDSVFDCDTAAGFVVNNPAGVDTLGHCLYRIEPKGPFAP